MYLCNLLDFIKFLDLFFFVVVVAVFLSFLFLSTYAYIFGCCIHFLNLYSLLFIVSLLFFFMHLVYFACLSSFQFSCFSFLLSFHLAYIRIFLDLRAGALSIPL